MAVVYDLLQALGVGLCIFSITYLLREAVRHYIHQHRQH